jgi:hypothetical protein
MLSSLAREGSGVGARDQRAQKDLKGWQKENAGIEPALP